MYTEYPNWPLCKMLSEDDTLRCFSNHVSKLVLLHVSVSTTSIAVNESVWYLLPPQLQFVSPSGEEFEALQWQLRARMDEGQGEAIYEVGIGGTRA